jgi:hypothetical protein
MLGSLQATWATTEDFRSSLQCHQLYGALVNKLLRYKRDHKVTFRAHTWLIIRPFMDVMQESAKKDLVEGTEVEKLLAAPARSRK